MPILAPDSAHRGFLDPGTGRVFGWADRTLGWAEGWWRDPRQPLAGQDLDDFMQQAVAGITGLPGNLVRPRWQVEPPTLPPLTTDWCAVGVTTSTPLGFPFAAEVFDPTAAPNGFVRQTDTEEFDVLCSFYGPHADGNAVALRQGLMVAQNREAFQLLDMGLIQTSGRTRVPELLKQQYLMRVDITFSMRRLVHQVYPVLFFLSTPLAETTDTGYRTTREGVPPGSVGVEPTPLTETEVLDIPFQYLGAPQAGQPILRYTFVERVSFLGNLAGSAATVPIDSTATATVIFDIEINSINFGMMIFSPGVIAAAFSGPAQTFQPSDVLTVTPRDADLTLRYISGNLLGTQP